MAMRIDITGVRYTPDDLTKRYVEKKIGGLERYLPRHARKTLTADVKLIEAGRARGNKYECDVTMTMPDLTINAKDSTLNMLAAIDIVEEKLKNQIKRYSEQRTNHRGRHGLLAKIRNRMHRPNPNA